MKLNRKGVTWAIAGLALTGALVGGAGIAVAATGTPQSSPSPSSTSSVDPPYGHMGGMAGTGDMGDMAGMGFGENAQSSLITRGLAEMTRLGIALGASPLTFLGLAGIGDLVATCQSPLSRNRSFGERLGQGMTLEEATAVTTQTCEGVKSCQSILDLAVTNGVDMPITEQVVQVVHHGLDPRHMLRSFMSRATKAEAEMS